MTTALITHSDCLNHTTPTGHPERAARLEYMLPALEGKALLRTEAPLATEEDLLLVHPQAYIDNPLKLDIDWLKRRLQDAT